MKNDWERYCHFGAVRAPRWLITANFFFYYTFTFHHFAGDNFHFSSLSILIILLSYVILSLPHSEVNLHTIFVFSIKQFTFVPKIHETQKYNFACNPNLSFVCFHPKVHFTVPIRTQMHSMTHEVGYKCHQPTSALHILILN